MKIAAGTIRSLADSLIPKRLTKVRIARPASVTGTRWWDSGGKALPRLAAPAARLTATGSTESITTEPAAQNAQGRPRVGLAPPEAPPPSRGAAVTRV